MNSFNNQLHSDELNNDDYLLRLIMEQQAMDEYQDYLESEELAAEDAERAEAEAQAEFDMLASMELEDEDWDGLHELEDFDEYDGQPSEYDEWQDYMGGDDWDHGQYDDYDW
jgi:hypothetical protein